MSTSTSNPSPVLEPWQEQLNLRISKFADALGLSISQVKEVLRELGIKEEKESSLTILDDEELLTMSDLFEKFVDTKLTDKPTLRLAVSFLRAKSKGEEGSQCLPGPVAQLVNALKPIDQWTDEELLKVYDEDRPDVARVLSERSKGRPFIVLDNGMVNVAESLKLLKIAKRQATNETHLINGRLHKIYRAGKYPAKALDESPFCPGKALVDNYCADSETDWTGVDHECRVLAAIQARLVDKGRMSTSDYEVCVSRAKMGFKTLAGSYKKAALMYEELKDQDQLPRLKVYPQNGNRVDTGF